MISKGGNGKCKQASGHLRLILLDVGFNDGLILPVVVVHVLEHIPHRVQERVQDVGNVIFLAQGAHAGSNLAQIVAGQAREQVVLDLVLQAAMEPVGHPVRACRAATSSAGTRNSEAPSAVKNAAPANLRMLRELDNCTRNHSISCCSVPWKNSMAMWLSSNCRCKMPTSQWDITTYTAM